MNERQTVADDGLTQYPCDVDDVFRLLANARRRELITALHTCDDDRIRLSRLRRQCTTGERADARAWERAVHHVHVPMLDDLGLVDYDADTETLRYYHYELIDDVLSAIDAIDSSH
ncbi:DUF7344 domain-containing protein [Natronorubrum aibiense]|uniref:DUF7344 domain-containing protein n=1 Tax=Natronorubrum aibiense TaxID=348826 RepID=A0A5P9P5M4_9EURY|nr:hypothetical protein [Natronorubrum aibiense]QFU83100.1 hypothetical protein GCU68_11400 [Natronorubrum aibiense]